MLCRFEQQMDDVAKSNPNFLLRYALETKIQSGVRYKYTVTPCGSKRYIFASRKHLNRIETVHQNDLITPKILLTLIH